MEKALNKNFGKSERVVPAKADEKTNWQVEESSNFELAKECEGKERKSFLEGLSGSLDRINQGLEEAKSESYRRIKRATALMLITVIAKFSVDAINTVKKNEDFQVNKTRITVEVEEVVNEFKPDSLIKNNFN